MADQLFKTQKIFGTNITGQQASLELNKLTNEIDGLSKKLFELSKTIKLPEITVAAEKIKIEPPKDPRFYVNSLRNLFKDIEDKEFTSKIVVNVQPQLKVDPAGIDKGLIEFQIAAEQAISKTMAEVATGVLNSAADAIAESLASGKDFLPNLFGNLIKGIGGQIKELGKYLTKIGVEMLLAKKAIEKLGLTPQFAIIAGVALQILGGVLSAQANKKFGESAFATGVRNFGGGTALVGERGPERVFLPAGSSVQPNNEMNAYGNGQMVFIPDITLRGTDLVIAFNRASDAMGRNN